MDKTFDFLTAIKHLLDGKKIRGKDWIGSWLMLDKDTLYWTYKNLINDY